MSYKITDSIWKTSRHEDSPLLLLLAIGDNANDAGEAWPGIDYLAAKIRKSDRQTQRLVQYLAAGDELAVEWGHGRKNTHYYHVLTHLTEDERRAIRERVERINAGLEPPTRKKKGDIPAHEKGDIEEPTHQKGDRKGDISQQEKVTFQTEKGDIAVSPEPENQNLEPPNRNDDDTRVRVTVGSFNPPPAPSEDEEDTPDIRPYTSILASDTNQLFGEPCVRLARAAAAARLDPNDLKLIILHLKRREYQREIDNWKGYLLASVANSGFAPLVAAAKRPVAFKARASPSDASAGSPRYETRYEKNKRLLREAEERDRAEAEGTYTPPQGVTVIQGRVVNG